jgi:hypothetical protein
MRRTLPAFLALLFLASGLRLVAQEAPGSLTIRKVEFHVTGRSLPFVMMKKIDPYRTMVGSSFPDAAALEAFIADRRQVLLNERVLASVETSYEATPVPSGGMDIVIRFDTVDTWNLIALPYAKYDSNTGLLLSLRGRDYDFGGSMQELAIDLDYRKNPAGRSSYTGALSFDLPFQALGNDWSLGFHETGGFWTDGMASTVTQASLSLELPALGFPAQLTATQGISYNALAASSDLVADPDTWFLSEGLGFGATLPLTRELGSMGSVDLGPIEYSPSVSISLNWKPGSRLSYYGDGMVTQPGNGPYGVGDAVPVIGNGISYGRGGLVATVGNALSFGRVDWSGNMRAGLTASLGNVTSYNAQYQDIASDLSLGLSYFDELGHRLGLATMLTVLTRLSNHPSNDALANLGWYLRGIIDDRISGIQGAFINVQLPVKLFDFPTHAFIKTRILDFELQAAPFVDAAIVRPDYRRGFSEDWLLYTGGLEFLAFPAGLRSFIVRASAGWDLKNVIATRSLSAATPDGRGPYEIFIGLGLKY